MRCQLTQPAPLPITAGPLLHDLAGVVELHAAVVGAGPYVEQLVAQFGMPDQRRQVVDGHRHADVVHRGVRQGLDRPVGSGTAAKQPEVAGAGFVQRSIQR